MNILMIEPRDSLPRPHIYKWDDPYGALRLDFRQGFKMFSTFLQARNIDPSLVHNSRATNIKCARL